MKKIQISKLVQDEIRATIPYITDDGKKEFIIIKNPMKSTKEELGNIIWKGIENPEESKSNSDLIAILFEKLTNIDLNLNIDDLMENEISYELNVVLFYLTEILTEITNEVLMNANITISKIETNDLRNSISDKTKALEEKKKIKTKKVN